MLLWILTTYGGRGRAPLGATRPRDTMSGMDAAELVRSARTRAGLSQRQLALRAGVSQPAVARLESGRHTPSLTTLARLLAACGERLVLDSVPVDDHDLSLLESTLALSVEQRIDRLLALQGFADELRTAVAARG
jgi:transcriptional regulator with XRE-family HTH domain